MRGDPPPPLEDRLVEHPATWLLLAGALAYRRTRPAGRYAGAILLALAAGSERRGITRRVDRLVIAERKNREGLERLEKRLARRRAIVPGTVSVSGVTITDHGPPGGPGHGPAAAAAAQAHELRRRFEQ